MRTVYYIQSTGHVDTIEGDRRWTTFDLSAEARAALARPDKTVLQQKLEAARASMARRLDDELLTAIMRRTNSFSVLDLAGRCTSVGGHGGSGTTYYLDGEPILQVGPMRCVGEGCSLTIEREFKHLP